MKGEPEGVPVVLIGEVRSLILQSQLPSMLQDHGSFSIPCCIGGMQIKRALCDLGASVSLLPHSLCKKLELLHLKPTTTIIQLADCTLRRPTGVLEDIAIQVGKFIIRCDFIMMDIDESSQIPIILRRPFLATAGAVINVQAGTMSFQFCVARVDFYFPPSLPSLVLALPSPPEATAYSAPHTANFGVIVFEGN